MRPSNWFPLWLTFRFVRFCWWLMTWTNSVLVWFLYYLASGETMSLATWDHARRAARIVAWAERCDRMKPTPNG